MEDWHTGELYRVGDRTRWNGATLVCTTEHFAGGEAWHPWDPGDGWDAERASFLWTPATPADRTTALRAAEVVAAGAGEDPAQQRLTAVVLYACGVG